MKIKTNVRAGAGGRCSGGGGGGGSGGGGGGSKSKSTDSVDSPDTSVPPVSRCVGI